LEKRVLVLTLMAVARVTSAGLAQYPQSSSTALRNVPLSVEEVVKKLQQKNQERQQALRQFQSTRFYRMQYRGFPSDREAEMTVKVNYSSPNKKDFTVLSQSGSKFIIDHVFKKLIEGEQEAANEDNQRRTALSEENYDFQMDGHQNTQTGGIYILQVTPKTKSKFLYRRKIWVDAKDFAVTQIEGEAAKNPSFWIKKTDIEHKYVKVDEFWLPAENHTENVIRLGGRATLTIEYKDYKVIAAEPVNHIQNTDESSSMAWISSMVP
jgi:outer membrane lipoprotein-sorting protein